MSEAIFTDPAEQTLEAREYLQFLRLLETQGMPADTRAYLVYIDEGQRKVNPVARSASVLDIEKDLFKHLRSWPHPIEWLKELRDFATDRLTCAKVDLQDPEDVKRETIAREAAWEVESIGQALVKGARASNLDGLLVRGMALRLVELGSITMGALDQDDADELAERLYGRFETIEA